MAARPQQFTLAIEHPHEQRLDNFVVGDNQELLRALASRDGKFHGYWVYGAFGVGRSHLLRGKYLLARKEMQNPLYISASEINNSHNQILQQLSDAGQSGLLILIDDIGELVGDAVHEAMLLLVYQRLLAERGTLIVSHTSSAQTLEFATPDLASRMCSLEHFHVHPLDDEAKMQLLSQRAKARGYDLSDAVLDYWLVRGPRDIASLLSDLDRLDIASLAEHQPVTIPLLKRVLGY